MKETPKGFGCECGKFHEFGVYVAAHWQEDLRHTCDKCGATHAVQRGHVRLLKVGRQKDGFSTSEGLKRLRERSMS